MESHQRVVHARRWSSAGRSAISSWKDRRSTEGRRACDHTGAVSVHMSWKGRSHCSSFKATFDLNRRQGDTARRTGLRSVLWSAEREGLHPGLGSMISAMLAMDLVYAS